MCKSDMTASSKITDFSEGEGLEAHCCTSALMPWPCHTCPALGGIECLVGSSQDGILRWWVPGLNIIDIETQVDDGSFAPTAGLPKFRGLLQSPFRIWDILPQISKEGHGFSVNNMVSGLW